jgi:hypothetical protein
MIKNKINRKKAKRPTLNVGDFLVVKKAKLLLSESLYFGHVSIRKVHDKFYSKSKIYKKYSDHPSSTQIHKGTLIAFVVSFTFFTTAQYLLPQLFNFGVGNKAYAAQKNKVWTTNGDFATATNSNLYISGSGAVGNPDNGNTDGVTLKSTSDFGKCTDATACPDVTINQGGTQNFYTLQSVANATVGSYAAAGQKNISISNSTGSFTVGKKVLIAQMSYSDRASYLALPNGGQEEGEIAAVNGSTITLKNNLIKVFHSHISADNSEATSVLVMRLKSL